MFRITAAGAEWSARQVVLATGHTPLQDWDGSTRVLKPYYPSLPESLDRVAELLQGGGLGILGTSAAALDVLLNIDADPQLAKLSHITMISSSGQLPGVIAPQSVRRGCETPALEALAKQQDFDAEDLLDAALVDTGCARDAGVDSQSIYEAVMPQVTALLPFMVREAQRRYVDDLGLVLSRVLRRTGPGTLALAEGLQREGRLTLIAADIAGLREVGDAVVVDVRAGCAGGAELLFDCVIDCRHGRLLAESVDPLLRQLLAEPTLGLRLNSSGRGLAVNDALEAAPGLYVLGPLLNGTLTSTESLWHVERASTLWRLADDLAQRLAAGI